MPSLLSACIDVQKYRDVGALCPRKARQEPRSPDRREPRVVGTLFYFEGVITLTS